MRRWGNRNRHAADSGLGQPAPLFRRRSTCRTNHVSSKFRPYTEPCGATAREMGTSGGGGAASTVSRIVGWLTSNSSSSAELNPVRLRSYLACSCFLQFQRKQLFILFGSCRRAVNQQTNAFTWAGADSSHRITGIYYRHSPKRDRRGFNSNPCRHHCSKHAARDQTE